MEVALGGGHCAVRVGVQPVSGASAAPCCVLLDQALTTLCALLVKVKGEAW